MKALFIPTAILALAGLVRADEVTPCFSFYANPDTYYAPAPPSFNPNAYSYSFVVTATYTNNCTEVMFNPTSEGTDVDAFIVVSDLFPSFFALDPGESITLPFAGYVWSPNAPVGYTWTANINADNWGFSQFTAIVTESPVVVPEPGTLLLLVTGLSGMAVKLRRRLSSPPRRRA